jgi:hypothetical protein
MSWLKIATHEKPNFCVRFFHNFINGLFYGILKKQIFHGTRDSPMLKLINVKEELI